MSVLKISACDEVEVHDGMQNTRPVFIIPIKSDLVGDSLSRFPSFAGASNSILAPPSRLPAFTIVAA